MAKVLESIDGIGEQIVSFATDDADPCGTMQFTMIDTQALNPSPFRIDDPDSLRELYEVIGRCLEILDGEWPEEDLDGDGSRAELSGRKKGCKIQVANGTMTAELIDSLIAETQEKERIGSV